VLLFIIAAAFFVASIAWAAWFKLDEVARGECRITTRSQVQA
jgi:hypothetical protein